MVLSLNLRLVLLLCTVILSSVLIVYSWLKGKKNSTLNSYLFFQIALFIWSLSQIFRFFAVDHQTEWLEVRIEYFAICFIGLWWLIFCLRYTESKFVHNRRNIVFLYIIPTICYMTVLTNKFHHLFFSKYDFDFSQREIIFWIHTYESYSYCLLGTIILISYSFKQYKYFSKQIILLVVAALIPIITNIALICRIFSPRFDITPLSFTFSLFFFAIAIFKYKLLNTEAIALRKIVDNMRESILVTDKLNRISDFNHALVYVFSEHSPIQTGDDISIWVNNLQGKIEKTVESQLIMQAIADSKTTKFSGEISLIQPKKSCLRVNIQPIIVGKEVIGRVISFNDITDYKNLWDELHTKNNELSIKNQQLEKYATTVAELAVTKERNRFARDVHDTLGQTMTLLITLLQIAKNDCRHDLTKAENRLDEALKIAGEGLAEVRRSLIGLDPENINSLKEALQSLVADFQTSGMRIELAIDETGSSGHDLLYAGVIYRICQEALTNSLRHGKANHVAITLKLDEQWLHLGISDNGHGCKNLVKGFGLCGMEQRITNLKGNIHYEHSKIGFGIQVEIPLKF
jgi:signal transduction histidine kinase